MNNEIIEKAKVLYNTIMKYPNKVLEIFNDFYGEDRVDMQGFPSFDNFILGLSQQTLENLSDCTQDIINSYNSKSGFIIIHFPMTRVTNENDRFVDVPNLWVKIVITIEGKCRGYFGINRSEYQLSHMQSDYMHSHVSGINWSDTTQFLSPCLGSGPIRATLATLSLGYDEAMWQLFCLELDRYMRVESLAGIPYRYLERIGNMTNNYVEHRTFSIANSKFDNFSQGFSRLNLLEFVKYFIKSKKLKFNFINNTWGIAMSYVNLTILMSNSFIEWYNREFNNHNVSANLQELLTKNILEKGTVVENCIRIYGVSSVSQINYASYEGRTICTFKGRVIKLHIIESNENSDNMSFFLHHNIISEITKAILEILNYKYGREERNEEAGIGTPAKYL